MQESLEVDGKLCAVVVRQIDHSVVFGSNSSGRLQKVFEFFHSERGLIFVNRESHLSMIPRQGVE